MGDPLFMWDGTDWKPLGGGGGGYKGEWDPAMAYGAGESVTHDGRTWATVGGADPGAVPGGGPTPEPVVALDLHNDLVADAVVVPPGLTYDPRWNVWSYDSGRYFSTTGIYGSEPGEPNVGSSNLHTAWWTFTPNISARYELSTYGPENSDTDRITYEPVGNTNLYLYRRTGADPFDFSQLTYVSNHGSSYGRSWVTVDLVAATQYYISVGYYKGSYYDIPIEYRLCIDAYGLGA